MQAPPHDDAAALRVKEMELQLKMMADEAERRSAHERLMKVPAVFPMSGLHPN